MALDAASQGLCDFFTGRTGMIHFEIAKINTTLRLAPDTMAEVLNWDEAKKNPELKASVPAGKAAADATLPVTVLNRAPSTGSSKCAELYVTL